MSRQQGRNHGITALFDCAGQSAKFAGEAIGFGIGRAAALKNRSGRGSGVYGAWRPTLLSGQLLVTFNVRGDASPEPSAFYHQTGNVVLQFNTAQSATVAVHVDAVDVQATPKQKDEWTVTCTCRCTGNVTWAGFGTVPTTDTPSYADQVLYEGMGKTVDVDGLQDGATVYIDVVGTADTDAAEAGKIAALIAATAVPFTGAKWRVGQLVARDLFGCTFALTAARTTTGEDVINANTFLTTDASGLETVAKGAAWGTSPVVHNGLVIRKVTVLEYNDGKILYTTEEGLESVQAQREREASDATVDPNNLVAGARVGIINATQPTTPDAPTGTVYHSVESHKQEDGRTLWVFRFAPRDSKQEIEFDSVVSVDGSTLESRAELIVVQTTDAPAAAYTSPVTPPFVGAVYRDHRRKQITSNPAKYQYTYLYGYETRADEIVREHTRQHLGDWSANATTASWDGSGTHATLTAQTHTETILYQNGHTLTVKGWGLETDPQKWVRTNTWQEIDASGIVSKGQIAKIGSADVAPDGFVVVDTRHEDLIDGTVGYIVSYAKATTEQRIEAGQTRRVIDAGGLSPREIVTDITDSATPPTEPTWTVPGVDLYETSSEPLPENPAKWKHTFEARARTSAQEVEDEGTSTTVGLSPLESRAVLTVEDDNSTPPATPETPVIGQKMVRRTTRRRGAKWFHRFEYDWETEGERIVRTATKERIDVDGEESSATTAAIGGTPPAHGTLTKVADRTETLPDGTAMNVAEHGVAGPHLETVRRLAKSVVDPDGVDSKYIVATIGATTAGSDGGLELAETETLYTKAGTPVVVQRYDAVGGGAAKRVLASTGGDVDPYEYERWRTAETITVADAAALRTYLTTQFAALQTNVEFHKLSGHPLAGGKALVVTEYTKDEKILITDFEGGLVNMKSLGGQVSVVDVVPISSTWTNFTTDYCTVNRVTGLIIYRRRIVSATWSDALHASAIGLRNNAEILGIAAGYAQYAGAKVRSSEYVTGNHVRLIDYILRYDSLGFVEDSRVGIGNFHTDASVSKGFVSASTLGWTVSAPASTSLGFITA